MHILVLIDDDITGYWESLVTWVYENSDFIYFPLYKVFHVVQSTRFQSYLALFLSKWLADF